MDNIKLNERLSDDVLIKSIDKHLYRIGLSLHLDDCEDRLIFNKPLIIIIVYVIQLCKLLLIELVFINDDLLITKLGDFGHFIGIGSQLNWCIIFGTFFVFLFNSYICIITTMILNRHFCVYFK